MSITEAFNPSLMKMWTVLVIFALVNTLLVRLYKLSDKHELLKRLIQILVLAMVAILIVLKQKTLLVVLLPFCFTIVIAIQLEINKRKFSEGILFILYLGVKISKKLGLDIKMTESDLVDWWFDEDNDP